MRQYPAPAATLLERAAFAVEQHEDVDDRVLVNLRRATSFMDLQPFPCHAQHGFFVSVVSESLHGHPGKIVRFITHLKRFAFPGLKHKAHVEVEVRGVVYVNATVDWPGGSAYGLTADLLLEALEWGVGKPSSRGQLRLSELHSYYSQEQREEPG